MSVQETVEPPVATVAVAPLIAGQDQPANFADKLVGYLRAERGFRPNCPWGAAALQVAADIVLSREDGRRLEIVAIVDGEKTPGKTFDLSVEDTREIADACLAFRTSPDAPDKAFGLVTIVIIETTREPNIDDLFDAKDGFVRSNLADRRVLQHITINPETRNYRTSAKADDRFIAKVLAGPVKSPDDIAAGSSAPLPRVTPVVTYALLAVLAAIYCLELVLNTGKQAAPATPSLATLILLGGTFQSLVVGQDEWYRLWTAMFLHASPSHLILNGVALYFGGRILESLLGRMRYLALFFAGGLCGSIASLWWNPANMVGIGASGAIMACFAALLVLAFHFPVGRTQTLMIGRSIGVLIPSMLPFLNQGPGVNVDFAAHVGGSIGGTLMGLGFLATWPRRQALPGLRWPSIAIVIIGAGGVLCGVAMLAQTYSSAALATGYFENGIIAKDVEAQRLWLAAIKGADEFTYAYPKDPRGHIAQAIYLIDQGIKSLDQKKFAAAEAEAKLALEEKFILDKVLTPIVRTQGISILALAQNLQGRKDEALATAKPVCQTKTTFQPFLIKEGLCPADRPAP